MKRVFTLVLAAAMIFTLLAGCTDTGQEPDTSVTPTAASPTPGSGEPTDESVNTVAIPFPETKSFTAWITGAVLPTGFEDMNDVRVIQELERLTNVHFDWTMASMTNTSEVLNLMIASGTYTDIIFGAAFPNGYDWAVEEDIIIDLAGLVPEHMPRYWGLLTADEPSRKLMFTDFERFPGINLMNVSYEANFLGYMVRQDYLDEVGYTGKLETYNDWENVMELWKTQSGRTGALYMDTVRGGAVGQNNSLMAGFYTSITFLAPDRQNVVYAPIEQGYYDYLELMAHWYAEEYIDNDFLSRAGFFMDNGLFSGDQFGFFNQFNSNMETLMATGRENNLSYSIKAVDFPRQNQGDMQTLGMVGNAATLMGGSKACVTTQCEDPVSFLQWVDYLFTDEIYYLTNYGIAGESYNLVDGRPVYTELVTNDPDGVNQNEMLKRYQIQSYMPSYYDWARNTLGDETATAASAVWDARWDPELAITMPTSLSLTADESGATASILTDIGTYIQEYTAKVIIGETDLASTWENHVTAIKGMGIDDCIAIYQAAYDRYQTR